MPNQPNTPLPFANGFYKNDALKASAQECVNLYPVIEDMPSLQPETLRSTPGMDLIYELQDGSTCRGAQVFNSQAFFVYGNDLYRLDAANQVLGASLGTISGTARVSMAASENQLLICVPGGDGYIFTEGPDTLTQITDVDYTNTNGVPIMAAYVDGYFVVTTNAKKFKISAINDGLAWDALDFGSAESSPDGVKTPIVWRNQLMIFGAETTEVFANLPSGADFPFVRTGLFLDVGLSSRYAVRNVRDTVIWLGAGEEELPAIWMLDGNIPKKVSTRAIDQLIEDVADADLIDNNITAWDYGAGGNYFVGFNLPDTTIVYDVAMDRWHERRSFYDGSAAEGDAYRATDFVRLGASLFVGDQYDDRVYELNSNAPTEGGNNIERWWACMPFQNNMQALFVPALELTIDSYCAGVDGAVCVPPYFTQQPSETDNGDGTVTFTAIVGGTSPIVYDWQERTKDSSDEWVSVASGNGAAAVTVSASSGNEYRLVGTNSCGEATSIVVTITEEIVPPEELVIADDLYQRFGDRHLLLADPTGEKILWNYRGWGGLYMRENKGEGTNQYINVERSTSASYPITGLGYDSLNDRYWAVARRLSTRGNGFNYKDGLSDTTQFDWWDDIDDPGQGDWVNAYSQGIYIEPGEKAIHAAHYGRNVTGRDVWALRWDTPAEQDGISGGDMNDASQYTDLDIAIIGQSPEISGYYPHRLGDNLVVFVASQGFDPTDVVIYDRAMTTVVYEENNTVNFGYGHLSASNGTTEVLTLNSNDGAGVLTFDVITTAGSPWAQRTVTFPVNVEKACIGYGDGKWVLTAVAASDNAQMYIATSVNGTAWTILGPYTLDTALDSTNRARQLLYVPATGWWYLSQCGLNGTGNPYQILMRFKA